MTLFRQLIVAVLLLFVVLYAGNVAVSLHNNTNLVTEQMQVHAQDTATSLGLSMTQAAQAKDVATLDTLFNAISDSGYYQQIFFSNLDGEVLIDRTFPVSVQGVPAWFISFVELPSAEGKAQVAAGWIQLGEVTVVSHPGQAYLKLWQSTLTQLGWFAFVTLLVCLIAYSALKWLLVPLNRVEQQANAICERQFEVQPTLPKTRELRSVVEAMNRMAERLKVIFAEQLSLINRLREKSSTDPVTGLPNRSDFDARLSSFLSPETGAHSGVVMIVSLHNLNKINEYGGRAEGNALLLSVANCLKATIEDYPQAFVARRQGAEFAVFVPDIGEGEADEITSMLFNQVKTINWPHEERYPLQYHMGVSFHALMSSVTEMLGEADMALQQAKTDGVNQWLRFSDVQGGMTSALSQPLNGWANYLEACLEEKKIAIHYQPIFLADGTSLLGHEVFVRFPNEGEIISAGVVVPIAERLGLMPKVDMLILDKLAEEWKVKSLAGKMVANLSLFSLQSEAFMSELKGWLKSHKKLARSLIIEVGEQGMDVDPAPIRELQKLLNKFRAEMAIDHFGLDSAAFGYLGSLSLHHIKVHRSFISKLDSNSDNQFYIQSLCQLTHNSNIELWAEGVETRQEAERLKTLNVDCIQGFFLGKPSPNPVEQA